jgi:superfamily II DNA or RNA helicase
VSEGYQASLFPPKISTAKPRDYQIECIEKHEWWLRKKGVHRLLAEMATGTGKTSAMVWLAQHLGLYPVLALVDRIELANQMASRFEELCPELRVGVEQADKHADPSCDVIVASVPTVGRSDLGRMKRWGPRHFALVYTDEAHRGGPVGLEVLRYLKPELLSGWTATARRMSGVPLADIYDEVAFELGLMEAIDRDILCPFRAQRIRTKEDLSYLETHGFDFRPQDLAAVVNTDWRNSAVIDGIARYAKDRKSIVIKCANKAHVEELDAQLQRDGYSSTHILSHTGAGERAGRLDRFARGQIRIMVHCDTMTYGIDIPRIDCIAWAAPTMSPIVYTQMTGRGFRKHPEKKDLLVLDFVGACGRHDIMTASRIFGERDVDMLGEDVVIAAKAIKRAEGAGLRVEDGESINDILRNLTRVETLAAGTAKVETAAESVELFRSIEGRIDEEQKSAFPWMKTGEGSFGLRCGKAHYWLVADKLGRWSVLEGGATGKKHPIEGGHAKAPLADANKIIKRLRKDWRLHASSARWHREKASVKQIERLVELGIPYIDPEKLTRGAATKMLNTINMMKYIQRKGVPG